MRRHHERRRKGLRSVSVDLHDSEVEFLVRKGLLSSDLREDRGRLSAAVRAFLDDEFLRARSRGQLGHITVELRQPEIDYLIQRGRLAPESRRDPDAVLQVFSRIVHEAFGRL